MIQMLASRSRGIPSGDHPEFRFSKGLRIFLWVGVVAITVGPIVLTRTGAPIKLPYWVAFGCMGGLGCLGCAYIDRFVLKFWDDHISYGAFQPSDVAYKDIISAGMGSGGQGSRFLYIKTSKKRIAISGYLASVEDAARLLQGKLTRRSDG